MPLITSSKKSLSYFQDFTASKSDSSNLCATHCKDNSSGKSSFSFTTTPDLDPKFTDAPSKLGIIRDGVPL